MKNSWKIYSKDMNNVVKNWVAAIIIGGLIILPSLYAWFNIKASWDPYGQTDQIPIGVVDEDTGAEVRDNTINAGDTLVDTLKDNNKMEWHFTDREDAMEKLDYGDYFAVIVIPEDFSEKLATVTEDQPEKNEIEYFVNEKENAIAPKITDKGASAIVNQITNKFTSSVNGVIFDTFEDLGVELNENLSDIQTFEDYIFTMEDELPEIHDLLSNGLNDTKNAQSLINQAQEAIPRAEKATKNGLETVNSTSAQLADAQDQLNDMAPKIEQDLKKAQNTAGHINQLVQDAQNQAIDFSKGRELQQDVSGLLDDATGRIDNVEDHMKQLKALNQSAQDGETSDSDGDEDENDQNEADGSGNSSDQTDSSSSQKAAEANQLIDDAVERLETLRVALNEARQNGDNLASFIDNKKEDVDTILSDLEDVSGNTENRIGDFLQEYTEKIEPEVKQKISTAQDTLSEAGDILTGIKSTIPSVKSVLGDTEKDVNKGQDYLTTALGEYPQINDKVNQLADRIREIQDEADIHDIIELLKNDPQAERSFFEEPVKLNKNKVFPVQNYGAGMTPFYTVLAIWVGGLLLISLLATDVQNREDLTGRERYFGKLFTFITFGFMQTLIVTLGNLYLLGVEVAHPAWFILFALFIGLVFTLIIFTLVSLFGDVGKAMVIVLLVLQIAGAGGTYPVVLLPKFFQVIHPFLPFTYAIDLMREAVGGIIWETVIYDSIILAIIGAAVLLVGILFKNVLNKQTDRLMKKSREAGLFH